jgi:hypothetical protein
MARLPLIVFPAAPVVAGKERPGCFGSLPVCRCGCPVERRPLVVPFLVAASSRRCVLVRDGSAFVRLRCVQEGLNAGGKRLLCRGLGDGRVILRFCELLAGGHQVPVFPLGSLQFIDARADGGDTIADLLAAGLPAL